ncbi:MAG: peptide deformylase [Patescibacteria group bacterium]
MLSLIILPNQILRSRNKDLKFPLVKEITELISEMFKALAYLKGIGLAAPQIGSNINLMVIIASDAPRAYVNPKILKSSIFKEEMEEGCLSVPGVFGLVKRSKKILVEHFTVDGKLEKIWLEGMMARVYQHEVDHLNGVLFIDKTNKITIGRELLNQYVQI